MIQERIAGGCLRIGVAAAKYPAAISARSYRTPWECQKLRHLWQRRSGGAAAATGANRGGRRAEKNRGSKAARRPTEPTRGQKRRPPSGAPGPRGRPTGYRAEGRPRGRARAKGPKPRGMGHKSTDHRAEARPTRSAPGSGRAKGDAPGGPRSAQKGRGTRRRPTARPRYNASPRATRTLRFGEPRALPSPPEARRRY